MSRTAQDRALLERLFRAAVAAAQPEQCLPPHLPEPPTGRTIVVGGGKAAGAMAAALERHWPGELSGLVVTRDGHAERTRRIEVVEASHPVPDERGLAATRRILELVSDLGSDDLVICLLSGGGSALLTCPAEGLTLADKQAVTRGLLRSGAPIQDVNAVRRHLSAIKGGGLARAAAPARVVTLAISDVVGDAPAVIASGPTVPEPMSAAEARELLQRYGVETPPSVLAHLKAQDRVPPPQFAADYRLIARPADALAAAAACARAEGLEPIVLGDAIEGEARDVAPGHADRARRLLKHRTPAVLLSGGELTVTVRGAGMGGPNQEYALALALVLDGCRGISALAADTDGSDGTGDAAGAFVVPATWTRARDEGVDLGRALVENDAYHAFAALGDLFVTGPTYTNVNDFRAIVIRPPAEDYYAP